MPQSRGYVASEERGDRGDDEGGAERVAGTGRTVHEVLLARHGGGGPANVAGGEIVTDLHIEHPSLQQACAAENSGDATEVAMLDGGGSQTVAERALAELIVSSLQLETAAAAVEPTMRLFGEGLGLDSIDALELALAISRAYGFDLRSDDERNQQIFATLRSLSAHVEAHRTR